MPPPGSWVTPGLLEGGTAILLSKCAVGLESGLYMSLNGIKWHTGKTYRSSVIQRRKERRVPCTPTTCQAGRSPGIPLGGKDAGCQKPPIQALLSSPPEYFSFCADRKAAGDKSFAPCFLPGLNNKNCALCPGVCWVRFLWAHRARSGADTRYRHLR